MEVYLHRLPLQADLSDRGLRAQLKPFMERLHINERHYDCNKPNRKPFAFITFLYDTDAELFLKFYGEIPRGKGMPLSRLTILGANVLCKRSSRPASAITLKGLNEQARKEEQLGISDPTVYFSMRTMRCGYFAFISNKLHYIAEVVEHERGTIRIGKHHVTVERNDGVVIHIPLLTIHEFIWSQEGSLLLSLDTVPIMLSAAEDDGKRTRLTALNGRHRGVVGACFVYQFDVSPDHLSLKMQRLHNHNLGRITVSRYDVPTATGPSMVDSLQHLQAILSQATTNKSLPFPVLMQLHALVFNAYLPPTTVATLATRLASIWHSSPVSVSAMKKLAEGIDFPSPNHYDPSEFEVPALLAYLLEMERSVQSGGFVRDSLMNPGRNMAAVYRVCVTPTRISLHGPEFEKRNRVLRKYPNHNDHFIRVQFCDEDGQSLRFSSRTDFTPVYDRFRQIMNNGIQIAGRTYGFLGWSHSSLRAHSMWFIAPFVDDQGILRFASNIVSELGDFANIHSPARCAARIGQAFSETPFTVPVTGSAINVSTIPDVASQDGQRVFSDGVGTVSEEVVSLIWSNMPQGRAFPTCFQVRYAGAKGMLSLDTRLSGRQILLRDSMIKFHSNERTNLEICDAASRPIPLYMNRQLVKILEDMGVPRSWFLGLQNAAVEELRVVSSSAYNMASYLRTQSVGASIKLHKLFLWADRMGLDYHSDPFLRRVTSAVILRELRLLKDKARMRVPYGVTLFGVMDETGFLQEGEVYVTFEKRSKSRFTHFRTPPGNFAPLLVTRSPALHPGDIQRARNVMPPVGHPLRALRNCVVFSARGKRDLPSQLSGGDLDGDIFNVIWDPDVCRLPNLKFFDAADYPRQEPLSIRRTVKREDIVDFFIDFIRTDHLGAIATRHIILADQLELGTLDAKCIAVAEMHSTAVDFSKTGNPADLRKLPGANKFRPDFLAPGPLVRVYERSEIELEEYMAPNDDEQEKLPGLEVPNFKYYRSEKTLGVLYRAIDEKTIWKEHVQVHVENNKDKSTSTFFDTFLGWATTECRKYGCHNWQEKEDEAALLQSAYDDTITNVMYSYSEHATVPLTELEVFIGTIINKTGSQTIRQRDRSRKLHDEFERISALITAQLRPRTTTRAQTEDNAYDDSDDSDEETDADADEALLARRLDSIRFCLACLHGHRALPEPPTQSQSNGRHRNGTTSIESFWIVAATALLRELEFVRQAWAVDADMKAAELGMARLALGLAEKNKQPIYGVPGGVSLYT